MIALVALVAAAQGPTALDFFPLQARTRHVFEEKSLQNATTADVVGEPILIDGSSVTPIATFQNDQKVNTAYYRIEGDTVWLVAYDPKAPLPKPMVVLKVPSGNEKSTWDFEGPASTEKYAEPLLVKGEAQLKGVREVLGTKVPVLEVKITALLGGGKAKEQVEQVALYGKGVGLVELTSTTKIGKRKAVNILKLVKIEAPSNGGGTR